jgi:hypothetical protein
MIGRRCWKWSGGFWPKTPSLRARSAARAGSNGKIAVLSALLFSALLLFAGFPGGALACVITTGVVCAMWFFLEESDPKRSHPPR